MSEGEGYGSALRDASPEAWRWLDAVKPPPEAADRDALRFHSAWMRILLQDLGTLGLDPVTHEAAARILQCPVGLIPAILDRLRTDDSDGNRPALTPRDFARIIKSN